MKKIIISIAIVGLSIALILVIIHFSRRQDEKYSSKNEVSSDVNTSIEGVDDSYTVTFVDYDDAILKVEIVENGMSATAPIVSSREEFIFSGWDSLFDNVTTDLTIRATYTKVTEPTIIVENIVGSVGEEVELLFKLVNSPKLFAMSFQIVFDDTALALISAESGKAMGAFTYTSPSSLKNGSNFVWYANDPCSANGEVLKLIFKIRDNAVVNNYSVSLICDSSNTYDINDNDVELDVVDGLIIVKQ